MFQVPLLTLGFAAFVSLNQACAPLKKSPETAANQRQSFGATTQSTSNDSAESKSKNLEVGETFIVRSYDDLKPLGSEVTEWAKDQQLSFPIVLTTWKELKHSGETQSGLALAQDAAPKSSRPRLIFVRPNRVHPSPDTAFSPGGSFGAGSPVAAATARRPVTAPPKSTGPGKARGGSGLAARQVAGGERGFSPRTAARGDRVRQRQELEARLARVQDQIRDEMTSSCLGCFPWSRLSRLEKQEKRLLSDLGQAFEIEARETELTDEHAAVDTRQAVGEAVRRGGVAAISLEGLSDQSRASSTAVQVGASAGPQSGGLNVGASHAFGQASRRASAVSATFWAPQDRPTAASGLPIPHSIRPPQAIVPMVPIGLGGDEERHEDGEEERPGLRRGSLPLRVAPAPPEDDAQEEGSGES